MTFPEQYTKAVKMARSTRRDEWSLDENDEAHLSHIYDNPNGDRLSTLIWADKLQEDGHEDLSHLLRHGAELGLIERSSMDPIHLPDQDDHDRAGFVRWAGRDYEQSSVRQRHAALHFYFGPKSSKKITVRVPTANPEYRHLVSEATGWQPSGDEHWTGVQPTEDVR